MHWLTGSVWLANSHNAHEGRMGGWTNLGAATRERCMCCATKHRSQAVCEQCAPAHPLTARIGCLRRCDFRPEQHVRRSDGRSGCWSRVIYSKNMSVDVPFPYSLCPSRTEQDDTLALRS